MSSHLSITNPKRFDRELWLAILLAAMVIIPRSIWISHSHSESIDDEYHLFRGLRYWERGMAGVRFNDPPLGEALCAFPLALAGCEAVAPTYSVIYNQRYRPETLLMLVAAWKAILFLPMIGVGFIWVRSIYNSRAAWIAAGVLTFEPNLAAHIATASVDIPAVEAVVIACFLAWRYFKSPTFGRLCALCVATAAALLTKHTALALPLVILAYAVLWWIVKRPHETWSATWQARALHVAIAILLTPIALWALTLFDVSHPKLPDQWRRPKMTYAWRLLNRPLPAGAYVGAFANGWVHSERGHAAYLFGEKGKKGWWYYFPIVMAYKVPIGIWLLGAMAIASLLVLGPRWDEWSLLVPMLVWSIFLMSSGINIGFRHFLPAYAFMLLLMARAGAAPGHAWLITAWSAVAAASIHALSYHPNYLSYFNFPRRKPYYAINDSNIDWGQSIKQVRHWLDEHPQPKRTVYLRHFGRAGNANVLYYLGDRVTTIDWENRPPMHGILIISPMAEAGVWDEKNRYRRLRKVEPIAVIGDCMRVYDLDQIPGWQTWVRQNFPPTTRNAPSTKEATASP